MNNTEKQQLYDECWLVINRVNALIGGLENNLANHQPVDIQEAINACINITNQVIHLGQQFGVDV